MNLTYTGPFEAVRLLATGELIQRGTPVEVDDLLAVQLQEQGWEPVAEKKAPKATTTTKAVKADKKENV